MKATLRIAALILLAIVLAGCSRDEQPAADSVRPDSADLGTDSGEGDGRRALEEPLPNGTELTFSHHLRRDFIQEVNPGEFQRRLRIEHFEPDRQHAIAAITKDLVAAGYRAGSPREIGEDRTRISFSHKKEGRMTVTVLENVGLSHPAGTGLIYIHIPVEAPVDEGTDNQKSNRP